MPVIFDRAQLCALDIHSRVFIHRIEWVSVSTGLTVVASETIVVCAHCNKAL